MTARTIDLLWCTDPQREAWQLGRLRSAAGRVALLAWVESPPAVDAGVPPRVGDVLATALTSVARVALLVGSRSGQPAVEHTRVADAVAGALDDPSVPWWMQAQVLVLSDPRAAAPILETRTVLGLRGDDWIEQGQRLQELGVVGLVRPGVDGDVAGLWIPAPSWRDAVARALEDAAGGAGLGWHVLSEEQLADRLVAAG
ncbi:MAG: hypothetical protein AB1Z98_26305 [Nannocystaceae bacterium]